MDFNALVTSICTEAAASAARVPASPSPPSSSSAVVKQPKSLFDRAVANSNALADRNVALGLPKYMAKYSLDLLANEDRSSSVSRKRPRPQLKGPQVVLGFKAGEMAANFKRESPLLKGVRESFLKSK